MRPNSVTFRRQAPEGSVFTTISWTETPRKPDLVLINIGKGGSQLKAAADWGARLTGEALRNGADPLRIAEITADIKHDRSNGHFEASSLADAVARSLMEFVENIAREAEEA